MKYYEEIIGLNDYFQPVYDLENEIEAYWKSFIPNEKFYKVLSEMLNSLESSNPSERKSIWIQGAYGTGKSHATAVIKHLLYDDLDEITDFIDNLEIQMKNRIKIFRREKRGFPIVLKGTSSIIDNRTFALVLEKAVKKALKTRNISIYVEDDFDRMIRLLTENVINYETIMSGTKLQAYGSKDEVLKRLKNQDINMVKILEEILSQKGYPLPAIDIKEYLIKLINELKTKGIADYLVIYWDEFTGILELPKSGLLLTELQNIAELSINKGIYLFIVAHKRRLQSEVTQKELDKVLDRFKVLDYAMEPITTYHIINAAIKKKDMKIFTEIKDKYMASLNSIIDKIAGREGTMVQSSLRDLFPIHPYTAYLATFIARHIGSTERSIFEFLYGKAGVETSFKKFIKENPKDNGRIFLTADYLWDFFYEEFERMESEKVHAVLEKFKLHKGSLERKGDEYLSVFKGILLLNLLNRFVEVGESSLVVPSENNIINLFAGAIDQEDMNEILSFIDSNQIINKTPDNLYLITSSGLPLKEIENEKNRIIKEYSTFDKILNGDQKSELKNILESSLNRNLELIIMDASLNEHSIRRKIEKAFKKYYTIHLCLFLGKSEQELHQIKSILKAIFNDDDLRNIIFIVSEVILDDNTLNRFIEYKARAIVADKHNYSDERNTNEEYARKIIDGWINKVKSGYIEWFLQNEKGKEIMNQFSRKINKELSMKIFTYGLENIDKLRRSKNVWRKENALKSAEIFLFARNRDDLERIVNEKKNRYPYLLNIIKDNHGEYIVDINLKIKENVPENHPIKKMYLEIRKIFEKEKGSGVFNIGDTLSFLTKPPYGLYPNMVNMAAVGFLMREYVGKLFEAGTGIPIQKEDMREKISNLFDYWENRTKKEKLDVRFGTEEEEKLIEVLRELFVLENVNSLNDLRWRLRDWIKNQGFPIWVFKFSDESHENINKALDCIFELIQSIDKEITYEKIKEYLLTIEDVEYDLEVLINTKDMKTLFVNWLKNIEKVEITDEDIGEVIDYLKRNMPEEVASWTEDKVREKVKDWYIEKQIKKSPPEPPTGGDDAPRHPPKPPQIPKEKREEVKHKIERTPAEKIRDILIKLIEEHPEIIDTVNEYLEG